MSSSAAATFSPSSAPCPPPSLALLPEPVLLRIFHFLPLMSLRYADRVCRRWASLKEAALGRRTHLYIANGLKRDMTRLEMSPEWQQSSDAVRQVVNLLQFVTEEEEEGGTLPLVKRKVRLDRDAFFTGGGWPLNSVALDRLTGLMPHIRVLRLVRTGTGYQELAKIKHLLTAYRRTLVDLSLLFLGDYNDLRDPVTGVEEEEALVTARFSELIASVLHSVNRLSALECLDLSLETPNLIPLPVEVHLPIVRRLRRLRLRTEGFCETGDRHGTLTDSQTVLKALFEDSFLNGGDAGGEEVNLEELYLGELPMTLKMVDTAIPPPLTAALRSLNLTESKLFSDFHHQPSPRLQEDFDALRRLATAAPHLTDLQLWLVNPALNLRSLVEALAPCQALVSLILLSDAMLEPWAARKKADDQQEEEEEEETKEETQQTSPPVLLSVKVLSLYIRATAGHRDYERLALAALFPAVQVVFLKQCRRGCRDCPFDELLEDTGGDGNEKISRKKLAALRRARSDQQERRLLNCFRLERDYFFRSFPQLRRLEAEADAGLQFEDMRERRCFTRKSRPEEEEEGEEEEEVVFSEVEEEERKEGNGEHTEKGGN